MRLPYLQVDGDFITQKARTVAALLGCSHAQAIGHLSLLWAWTLSQGSEDEAPAGLIIGQHAARLVRAAAGWDGGAEEFLAVLTDPGVGLIERVPEGFRVRGMERYRKAWDKQRKDRDRKADVRRNSGGHPTDGAGQTQTQTQTQKKEDPPNPPQGTGKPKAANLGFHERLSEVHMRHRGSVLPFDGRLGDAQHRALLNLAQGGGTSGPGAEDEVVRRFDHMLQRQDQPYEPGKHKGTTLAELIRPECWGANAKPPARRASGAQAPTMSQHNWDTLPPVHVAAPDASEPY